MKMPDAELATLPFPERLEVVKAQWESITRAEVRAQKPEQTTVMIGGRAIKATILVPDSGEVDDTSTLIRVAEHQQSYTDAQYIFAEVMRQGIAPSQRLIMLQNNGFTNSQHTIDKYLKEAMKFDGLVPYAKDKLRVLEELGVRGGDARISGWSSAARLAVVMASLPSEINFTNINADDPPSRPGRITDGVKYDFMKELVDSEREKARSRSRFAFDFLTSGTWVAQRNAVEDSGNLALSEVYNFRRLALDYARFGAATFRGYNRLLIDTYSSGFENDLYGARRNYPEAYIKLGRVIGSKMFLPTKFSREYADRIDEFMGDEAHGHATVNNPIAQTLLASRGLIPDLFIPNWTFGDQV
jgi:hypothetical protein